MVILILLLSVAVVFDFTGERIPNALIAIGTLCGLYYRLGILRETSVGRILLDYIFPLLLFFLFFAVKAMGAGDIKLFMVCGLFFGTAKNLWCIGLAVSIAAMVGIVRLLIHKRLRLRVVSLFRYFTELMNHLRAGNREMKPYIVKEHLEGMAKIHMAMPIFLGAVFTLFLGDLLK